MNTVLVRYGHSLRTKQYTKNPKAKYAVKAEISMKTISFNYLGETFGIFRRQAAEWRRLMFVFDIIGNMAIATSVDARGDSSHRKRRVLKRW